MTKVSIPNDWEPRPHQLPFFQAMDGGKKRACVVWHRRAGKDSSVLNFTAKEMFSRVGNYWHLFPKQRQARKAIWNGIDGQGRKILSQVFPEAVRTRTDGTEMMIEVASGATWQLCGSDNYDSLVGSNPVGVVFSEWALCDPNAWNYIRPMLAENGGWAIFIYTSRGKNHGYRLYNMAKNNPLWFCELLTVNDTKREDGTPVIGPAIIQEERAEGMSEEMIQQEYYCSFDAQIPGAIYAEELRQAYDDKRIRAIPIDPSLPLNTAWDLGHRDPTSIWFWQAVYGEIRLVGYYENTLKKLSHYIQKVQEFALRTGTSIELGRHLGPHDCEAMRLGQTETVQRQCRDAGIRMTKTERPLTKQMGIEAVRKIFYKLWIDDNRGEIGLNGLSEYQYEWDDKKKVYKNQPLHDWASHPADALQTLALGWNENMASGRKRISNKPIIAKVNFNVFK